MENITHEQANQIVNEYEFEICSQVISNARKKALWKLTRTFMVEWYTKNEGKQHRLFIDLDQAVEKYNSIIL